MKIFWIGFHIEGRFAMQSLIKSGMLSGIMSLDPLSQKKRSGVYDYKSVAENYNIPYYEVQHVNDQTSIDIIKQHHPDLLVVLGWSQLLNSEVLSIPRIGTIGAHASILPTLRGSAPINWALIKGLSQSGNTLIWIDEGVDTGKIIDQYIFEINRYDSCNSLYEKVALSNAIMLERSLPLIRQKGKIGMIQKISDEPVMPRRKPADGLINFKLSALEIYNFIRALTKPYPGSFFYYNDKKIIIWSASLLELPHSDRLNSAEIDFVYAFEYMKCGISIRVNGGLILINELEVNEETISGRALHDFFKKGDKL